MFLANHRKWARFKMIFMYNEKMNNDRPPACIGERIHFFHSIRRTPFFAESDRVKRGYTHRSGLETII
jgi:hypothetical protein